MSITAVGVVVWQAASVNGTPSSASFLNTDILFLERSGGGLLLTGLNLSAIVEECDQAGEKIGCCVDGLQDGKSDAHCSPLSPGVSLAKMATAAATAATAPKI